MSFMWLGRVELEPTGHSSSRLCQLSPRKSIGTIRTVKCNGCQEVVGSLSGTALNQKTEDHILEMFSPGLLSQMELEPHAH